MFPLLISMALASSAPEMNLRAICVASQTAALPEDKAGAYDECVREESAARDQVRRKWSQFPAHVRSDCLFPSGVTESYVELLTCLQMESGQGFGITANKSSGAGSP